MTNTALTEPAVVVTGLVKCYPKSTTNAVDGLSFTVERGEVFGLLGPNGAGKTTTVGVLTTRVLPTGGRASVAGLDVGADAVAVRTRLAVVPQRVNLDRSLSVADVGSGRAFLAVLGRDVFVTGKELPSFLAQVLIQPFFFLLVFGALQSVAFR